MDAGGDTFNEKLLKYPTHEMTEKIFPQIIYRALDQKNMAIMDNDSDGSFINSLYGIISKVLDQLAAWCNGSDIELAEVAMRAPSSSFVCHNIKNNEEDIDTNMVKLISYLKLLHDHMLGDQMEYVSVISAKEVELCEYAEEEVIHEKLGVVPMILKGFHLSYNDKIGINKLGKSKYDTLWKERGNL